MNTTQLECFLAVANFLNFSRAAEQLRITQPAVSYQVSTLEDELGVKLFTRTSKAVQLTQAGTMFLQYAGEILKLMGLSRARMQECQAELPEILGIGCHNFLELRVVSQVLAALRRARPHVVPTVRLIPAAALENLLTDGDVHILLTLQDETPPKVAFYPLLSCPMSMICAKDSPLAMAPSLTPDALRHAGKIAVCPPQIYPPSLFAVQSQYFSGRQPEEMLFCDNLQIAYALAEAGYCFLIMPDLPTLRSPGLVYRPISFLDPIPLGAMYHIDRMTPSLRQFLALAEEVLSGNPVGGNL